MRARSPHSRDVLASLPLLLARQLDTAEVAELLDALVAAGWRPGQLQHRIGAEPAQGSPERDAEHVRSALRALLEQVPPDVAHAREVAARERARADQRRRQPPPASAAVRDRALAQMRARLPGRPGRRAEPAPRTRPGCSLCSGEGAYFVTHEVHLCRRCVAVLATGEARLSAAG